MGPRRELPRRLPAASESFKRTENPSPIRGHRDPMRPVVADERIGFNGERAEQESEDRVAKKTKLTAAPGMTGADAHEQTLAKLLQVRDQRHRRRARFSGRARCRSLGRLSRRSRRPSGP